LGVRRALFPMLALGAPSRGCQLPDAILHGKRSLRPHGGAVQRLSDAEMTSEASWLAWAGVLRTPTRGPGQDTLVTCFRVLTLCSGTATAFGGALAQRYGSNLLPRWLLFTHKPSMPFVTSPAFGRLALPGPAFLPGRDARFVSPFGAFHWAGPSSKAARAVFSVLMHSSNLYLLGNCDSFQPETGLNYLTGLGTVSCIRS